MTLLTISDVATRALDRWLDEVMWGELPLWALPAPVAAFYMAGWNEANAGAVRQAREYEHKLDVAYLQAYSPKDRREIYQRRLDKHFRLEEVAFFAAGEERYGSANWEPIAA